MPFGAPERAPWMAKPDSFTVPLFGHSEPDGKHCITTFQYDILYIYADCIGALTATHQEDEDGPS